MADEQPTQKEKDQAILITVLQHLLGGALSSKSAAKCAAFRTVHYKLVSPGEVLEDERREWLISALGLKDMADYNRRWADFLAENPRYAVGGAGYYPNAHKSKLPGAKKLCIAALEDNTLVVNHETAVKFARLQKASYEMGRDGLTRRDARFGMNRGQETAKHWTGQTLRMTSNNKKTAAKAFCGRKRTRTQRDSPK